MKLSHVLSMLVAALFTAGAMTVGQSFAASKVESAEYGFGGGKHCASNLDPSQMTSEEIRNTWYVD